MDTNEKGGTREKSKWMALNEALVTKANRSGATSGFFVRFLLCRTSSRKTLKRLRMVSMLSSERPLVRLRPRRRSSRVLSSTS